MPDHAADRIIMCRRIADIDAGGAAFGEQLRSLGGDFAERGFPADFLPATLDALDGRAQPVGIVLQVGNRRRLGADMAAAGSALSGRP